MCASAEFSDTSGWSLKVSLRDKRIIFGEISAKVIASQTLESLCCLIGASTPSPRFIQQLQWKLNHTYNHVFGLRQKNKTFSVGGFFNHYISKKKKKKFLFVNRHNPQIFEKTFALFYTPEKGPKRYLCTSLRWKPLGTFSPWIVYAEIV